MESKFEGYTEVIDKSIDEVAIGMQNRRSFSNFTLVTHGDF
ncbi:hypothetical protein [Streptomyces sp. NPDC002078]